MLFATGGVTSANCRSVVGGAPPPIGGLAFIKRQTRPINVLNEPLGDDLRHYRVGVVDALANARLD